MKIKRGAYRKPLNLSVPGVYLYTLGISLLCWILGYIFSIGFPVYGEVGDTPLWHTICRIMSDKTVTYLIGLVLMTGSALLIQRTNYVLGLIREKTWLPFVIYILLVSTNVEFFPLKSTSVGIFCLILSLYFLFRTYHETESQPVYYKIGLLIGIGSLLWIHILWFLPILLFGMYSFKTLQIKTFLGLLLGVLTVYWFILGWCVWVQEFTLLTEPFATLWDVQVLMVKKEEIAGWVSLLIVAILTGMAALRILSREYEESLRTRQYLRFLIVFAIFSFLLFFLYEQSSEEFLLVACLPASILLGHFFTVNKGRLFFWGYLLLVATLGILILISLWNFLSITVI